MVVDREKAGMLGVTEQQVAQTVLASLVGNTQFAPVPFTDPGTGNQYFINVRLADRWRNEVADLKDVLREGRRRHGAAARQRGPGEALGRARSR